MPARAGAGARAQAHRGRLPGLAGAPPTVPQQRGFLLSCSAQSMRGDHPSPGYRLMSNVSCRRHHLFTVGVLLNSAARSPALTTPRPPVSVRVAADFLSGSFQSPGPFHFPVFPSLLPQATALPDFNHCGVFRSLLAVSCVLLAAGILEGTVRSESKPLLLLPPQLKPHHCLMGKIGN